MRSLHNLWRRSLGTRVVTMTVLLSWAITTLVGWLLLVNIADGLAGKRRDSAVQEARVGFAQIQRQIDAAAGAVPDSPQRTLTQLIDTLAATRGEDRSHELVLVGPLQGDRSAPVRASGPIGLADLPEDLVKAVVGSGGIKWRYSELSLVREASDVPVVLVGSQVTVPAEGDRYALFYVFSMADQQETLTLVRDTFMVGGLMLIILIAGVALVFVRQVVAPVREARQVAERLATGDLERRMEVRGDDDIARLSISFNQMAAALQTQIRRLENLSRLQQRFVQDVSHELRTPLTTVRMASQLLHDSRHDFPPAAARAAELLTTEVDRFEALLSELLDLSRFDAGAATLKLSQVNLADTAKHAAKNSALNQAGIRATAIGVDRPVIVEADRRRIDRIVRNVVENAIKYSGTDRVEFIVGSTSDTVSLTIRDFGRGLDEDLLEHVFDRFWREDPARPEGGTGLGLAIAREDARLHGGTLIATSAPGAGTDFMLELPKRHGARLVSSTETQADT